MSEIQIAKILRPHGVKGAVKVSVSLTDIPFSLFIGEDNYPVIYPAYLFLQVSKLIIIEKISARIGQQT